MGETIVADASPLIALAKLGLLSQFGLLIDKIIVPQAVAGELLAKSGNESAELLRALTTIVEVIAVDPRMAQPPVLGRMHDGEIEAMTLAKARGLRLLIDEAEGRRIATNWGIDIYGTVAVLLQLKQSGVIPIVASDLVKLRDLGYRISDRLFQTALDLAGEVAEE